MTSEIRDNFYAQAWQQFVKAAWDEKEMKSAADKIMLLKNQIKKEYGIDLEMPEYLNI